MKNIYLKSNSVLRIATIIGLVAIFSLQSRAQSCKADFYFNVIGDTVEFYDSSSVSGSYYTFWDFGDRSTSSSTNPVHIYKSNTTTSTYTACLYIFDSLRQCADTICKTITIKSGNSGSGCNASFQYTKSGGKYTFYGSNPPLYGKAEWIIQDGNTNKYLKGQTVSHQFNNSGYQWVAYYLYDSTGAFCDSTSKYIYIQGNVGCKADFYFFQDSTNAQLVRFKNRSTGYASLSWDFDNGLPSSTVINPSVAYSNPGIYTVCLVLYDSSGNVCDSLCKTVKITPQSKYCTADFTAYPSNATKNKISFTNKSSNYKFLLWTFGDGDTSMSVNPYHIYSKAGTYTTCLYLYDSSNALCDSLCKTIKVDSTTNGGGTSCKASYKVVKDSINKYNLYIYNTSTGTSQKTQYKWTFGDGHTSTSKNPSHDYDTFGIYQLCLTITDSLRQCSSTFCDTIGLDSNGNLFKRDGFRITIVNADGTGSSTELQSTKAKLYPNPSTGSFTVQFNDELPITGVQVMNGLGQVVLSENVNAKTTHTVDGSKLTTGIYIVEIQSEKVQIKKRLLIKR
jgi:PKD repeat protein